MNTENLGRNLTGALGAILASYILVAPYEFAEAARATYTSVSGGKTRAPEQEQRAFAQAGAQMDAAA
jgi:hypothetical protein